jgi:hypothetical protein
MKLMILSMLVVCSAAAHATDSITPCLTEVVKTAAGIKSYEVQLVADSQKGYHTMQIYKNEGAARTQLPSVEIYFQSKQGVSSFISVESRDEVMAYRERVAPTREGAVLINDGAEHLSLKITCYL